LLQDILSAALDDAGITADETFDFDFTAPAVTTGTPHIIDQVCQLYIVWLPSLYT
jgi:CheY-specific phosphatase CheX